MLNVSFWENQIARSPYLPLFGIRERPTFHIESERTVIIRYKEGTVPMKISISGDSRDLSLLFEGKEKLSKLLRESRIEFDGAFKQRLKWEAVLFLASQWEELKTTVLFSK
ncbi:hypothetical protein ACFFJY_04850 [Fictibacillus aquaticus]|uniref:SCP2 domain-containing protein n=1 Tax=Fictibacillus aquaticus TaxID=2021314 RepID=A0A235F4I7_9BACL|nr:hypothetical protein [Fictibacillus aquaticus]OYD56128.1 hypothetical protein CGZ90_19200 [Fictibacillus aquaticus]